MMPQFSESEYRRLMLLTYLGEWMLNAIRKEPDAGYEAAASKVYSFASGTPLADLIEWDEEAGQWVVSESFEEEAHAYVDEYDEITFWEELTARLTDRDLIERFGDRAVRSMHPAERSRSAASIANAYTREFEQAGLERLRIVD